MMNQNDKKQSEFNEPQNSSQVKSIDIQKYYHPYMDTSGLVLLTKNEIVVRPKKTIKKLQWKTWKVATPDDLK